MNVPPLDFSNNMIPSPAPPGNLTPQNAPQIVAIGWDDIESIAGVTFVQSLLGSVQNPKTNPNSTYGGATANLSPNACYAQDPQYACGDATLAVGGAGAGIVTSLLNTNHFGLGNHTVDHLENSEALGGWSGIPTCWKDPMNAGWLPCGSDTCSAGSASTGGPAAGAGPGACLDLATWEQILPKNASIVQDYASTTQISGFRAPRLEMNDQGLQAAKSLNYTYDVSLEEIQPENWVAAAVDADTDSMKGFNWFPWPYTLDNGSPGVWNQQSTGSAQWLTDFPPGLWELPVYEVYIPSKGGLGTTIANRMMAADKSCTLPNGMMPTGMTGSHCFLSDGELTPGQAETEVTGFDFNAFIYCRMTHDDWLATMKHTFLLRYYGSRAPLTYGSHPIEYTDPYDSYTLAVQANNYGYRDVTMWNKYTDRQQAYKDFIAWIKADPNLSQDTWFMSFPDLAAYMQKPFDKMGAPVKPDAVASPDSNGVFSRLGWTGMGATIMPTSGNSATITFNIAAPAAGDSPAVSYVQAGVAPGSLMNVSHFDVKYSTQVPFRIRLLANDGSSVTALLAGVGKNTPADRLARIRVKDFFPGPEASETQVQSMGLVDSSFMAKVTAIAIESAATMAAPSGTPGAFAGGTFTTTIEQLTIHGVATSSLCQ